MRVLAGLIVASALAHSGCSINVECCRICEVEALAESILSAEDAELLEALRSKRVKGLRWEEASLDEITTYIRTITGVDIVVTELGRRHFQDASISLQLDDVTVATLLDVVTAQHDAVWRVKDGVVQIDGPQPGDR